MAALRSGSDISTFAAAAGTGLGSFAATIFASFGGDFGSFTATTLGSFGGGFDAGAALAYTGEGFGADFTIGSGDWKTRGSTATGAAMTAARASGAGGDASGSRAAIG